MNNEATAVQQQEENTRRTITLPVDSYTPGLDVNPTFPLRDLIAAVQDAGYLIYEATELPEVTVVNGKPRLPARFGEVRPGTDRRTALYEEAFGKLALARWYEAEERRLEKRKQALTAEVEEILFDDGPLAGKIAEVLVERGWHRG